MRDSRLIGWLLLLPAATSLALFFVAPLLIMGVYSLRPDMRGGIFTFDWQPTFDHYAAILESDVYMPLLWVSVRLALGVAGAATLLAYPLAYFLVFSAGRRASLLLTLLILPFWTSYLLRIISWRIILGSTGLLNSLLAYLGWVDEPVHLLLYSRVAVAVTLVYVWLPFVALPIYATLQRIDRSLLEAAAILGAPPWLGFLRVTLPLSLPGVLAGFLMVFIPTVGEYLAPLLVGGSKGSLYGNIIELFFGDGINWPFGSAMAFIMLGLVFVLVLITARVVGLGRFVEP